MIFVLVAVIKNIKNVAVNRFNSVIKLSVLRSIRSFCLECQGSSSAQVKECADNKCMLSEFRLGDNDLAQSSDRKIFIRSALRAIRRNCMNCASSRAEVRKCAGSETCVLWTYRFGVSPKKYRDVRKRYFAPRTISLF